MKRDGRPQTGDLSTLLFLCSEAGEVEADGEVSHDLIFFAFHLFAGDFNALAPDEKFDSSPMPRWIRGMIWLSGREIGRTTISMMKSEGYVDAWRKLYADHVNDPGYTFPVWSPHVRLDYVFAPEEFASRFVACEVRRTPDAVKTASDHFPLLVELEHV